MGYAPTTFVSCPDIQDMLDAHFPTCKKRPPLPLYQFLWSNANRGDIQQLLHPSGGKRKTVVLTYKQPLLTSQVTVSDNSGPSCTASTKRGNLSKEFSIDTTGFMVEEKFQASDFMDACNSNQSIVSEAIQAMIDVLIEKQAEQHAMDMVALQGKWSTDISSVYTVTADNLIVKTLKDSTVDPYPQSVYDINWAIQQTDFCNGAVIFADPLLQKHYQLMEAGCCSSNGLDLGAVLAANSKVIAYDRLQQLAVGGFSAHKSWVIMPGAIQPVYWTYNNNGVAEAARATANYSTGVIYDNETGTPIDFMAKDDCGVVHVVLKLTQQLVSLPTDMYPPGHPKAGFTGFSGINVTNTP